MLDFVRTKQKSLLIKIAFALIILSFVIGYTMLTAPSDQSAPQGGDVAARVNGAEISYSAYQSAYSNLYNLYQSIYQENFNATLEEQLNLPRQALQQLIEEMLLVQEAEQLGLEVSKEELVASIAGFEAFQVNGQFNRDRYLQVLNYQRMTPEQFENAQRRQILTQKVRERLQQGISVSEQELREAFHEENDTVNLDYVWLTPELVETKVDVTEDGLESFFRENIEDFRIPEKVAIRYLQFDPQRYEDQIAAFNDDELERYYRRHLDEYEVQEQVKAAHILLKVPEDADEATVAKRRELAENLLAQLRGGADFAQLAKAYSDDQSNADEGGDLGYFKRGVMVSEFEEAAFSLNPGELSQVVRTPFGFHIIRVTEHIQPGVKPLVDVIDRVKQGLTTEKANQLAYEKAMDAYNINRKNGDLDNAAQANDLGVKETGLFAVDAPIDGIGREPEISRAAFGLQQGELARPVQTDQGIFLFTLKNRQDSYLPELAEVRARVEQAYRQERATTLARQLAEQLLSAAQDSKDLRAAAQDLALTVEESGAFSRSYGAFIPRIGNAPQLAEEAFTLSAEEPVASEVYTVSGKFLVAALKEAQVADFAALEASERSQLETRLLDQKKEQAVTDKINALLDEARLEILVPELSNAFRSQSS